MLTSRSRDAPARQQTLRATIGWSYELLDPAEQRVFRALSAFRGSFSLDAATAVCETDLEAVESLVLKNLVRPRFGTGRLLLLDTIREYAGERLGESGEADHVHRRHFEYFLGVARSANLNAGDIAPGGQRLQTAVEEQDNLRGALAWAIRSDEIELALELAVAVEQFWVANDPVEGVRWFRRMFEHPAVETAPPLIRAHALRSLGGSLHISGDPPAAERVLEQSLALFEEIGDEHGCAVLLHRLSITTMVGGDLQQAQELVESSHELHARNDDWWARTWAHAQTTGTLGAIARESGDEERALELVAESAELAGAVGVTWWQGGMLGELAALYLRQERIDEAERNARESLEIAARLGDRAGRVFGVGLLATVAAELGEPERAGRLWGAIENETAHAPLGGWARHRGDCEARVRRLSGPEFERGLAAGRELELDQAVSEALVRLPA
jgi:tetratricopeptide (TPR) repeat protein